MSGVSVRMKERVFRAVMKPAMLFGLETESEEKTGGRADDSEGSLRE